MTNNSLTIFTGKDYVVQLQNQLILADTSLGNITILLPDLSILLQGATDLTKYVKKISSDRNTVTIKCINSFQQIDGNTSLTLTSQNECRGFKFNSLTNYISVSSIGAAPTPPFISSVSNTSRINLNVGAGNLTGDFSSLNISQFTNDSGYTTNTGTVTSIGTVGLLSGGTITTSGNITTSVATNKLIGRGTAGTGIFEAITLGSGLALSGTTLNITNPSGTVTSVTLTTPTGLSISGSPITTSGTLAISLTSGYVIPTTTEETNWNTAYTNRITSLTTTGSSGVSTLIANTLNIPNYSISGLSPLTTKGDLFTYSTINTRLAIGSDATILIADSSQSTGNKWIALSGDITIATTGVTTIKTDVSLAGNPTTTTQTTTDNSTRIATTAFVTTGIANAIAGVNPAVAVQAATTTVLPNSPTYLNGVSGIGASLTAGVTNTALVVDGYTPVLNERVLVKNQVSAFQNGAYFVSQVAAIGLAWIITRALDYDQPSDINNTGAIPVVSGTVNATTSWLLTSQITTVGTDSLTYTQFSYNPSALITTSTSAGGDLTGTYPNPTITALAVTNSKIANSTINLTTKVTGILPSANGGNWVLLSTTSASGASTVDFTGFSSSYTSYVIEFYGVTCSVNSQNINLRIGTGVTPTYQSGSVYEHQRLVGFASTSLVAAGSGSDTVIAMATLGTGASDIASGKVWVYNPSQSTVTHQLEFNINVHRAAFGGSNQSVSFGTGIYQATTAVTALRFLMDSGNITGTFYLYGIQ